MSEGNDRRQDGGGFLICGDPVDKRFIDLPEINRKLVEVAERGVADAEIVHQDVNAQLLERVERLEGAKSTSSGINGTISLKTNGYVFFRVEEFEERFAWPRIIRQEFNFRPTSGDSTQRSLGRFPKSMTSVVCHHSVAAILLWAEPGDRSPNLFSGGNAWLVAD